MRLNCYDVTLTAYFAQIISEYPSAVGSVVFFDSSPIFHVHSFIHFLNVAHRQGKRQNSQPTDSDDNTVTAVQRRYQTLWHGHDIWNSEIMYIMQQYIDTILFPCHSKLP